MMNFQLQVELVRHGSGAKRKQTTLTHFLTKPSIEEIVSRLATEASSSNTESGHQEVSYTWRIYFTKPWKGSHGPYS